MNKVDDILYIDERIDFEDIEAFSSNVEDVKEVILQTNDVHPAIMQMLFCISKEKNVVIEDKFNSRFFDNLHFN